MDKRIIFWGLIVCILLLLFVNLRMNSFSNSFKENCKIDYSKNIEEEICPCGHLLNFSKFTNYSSLNINYLNSSLYVDSRK